MSSNEPILNDDLLLGRQLNDRVAEADQLRQLAETREIVQRLESQPGVILADEVGMGKTFVALAVAWCTLARTRGRPVIVMVPANLIHKWEQDLRTFCALYLNGIQPQARYEIDPHRRRRPRELRYGCATTPLELLCRLDDPAEARCQMIFLAKGAMTRKDSDPWVRLALIRHTLRRYARRDRLNKLRDTIHRFTAELIHGAKKLQNRSTAGEDIWAELLRRRPRFWRDLYNQHARTDADMLDDDPVPRMLMRAMGELDLSHLADVLEEVPLRRRGGEQRMQQRLKAARESLQEVERQLWSHLIAGADWSSPLLIMDEAHHLKNPETRLARQFVTTESAEDLKAGDGALAHTFDRMLFMTATPFQLGHDELVRVIERFGNVRWRADQLGPREQFHETCADLKRTLNASQRTAIQLQQTWHQLDEADLPGADETVDAWWQRLRDSDRTTLTHRQRAVLDAFDQAAAWCERAQEALQPWIIRHNKPQQWPEQPIPRRELRDGAAIGDGDAAGGLPVPPSQLLAFFLAARSAADPRQDLLGDALCSSYQAFRHTRADNRDRDAEEFTRPRSAHVPTVNGQWYLDQFDRALGDQVDADHPKVAATVRRAVDLWNAGEKVLVFAFFRRTCRTLALEISRGIERKIMAEAGQRLGAADEHAIEHAIKHVQERFFDDTKGRGRRAVDEALKGILAGHADALKAHGVTEEARGLLVQVMRRFLRVRTTLVRAFPLDRWRALEPAEVMRITLDATDRSGFTWGQKFDRFLWFLLDRCTADERRAYLDAAGSIQTGDIRVANPEDIGNTDTATTRLPNVQMATGETKQEARPRLMRAFNTPFFPDVLVSSPVMAEGVDLHLSCRHVIHHDLAWNPSAIEQRTGRVDRLGCKAENRDSIEVYRPYISGAADERQYRVMTDRERWFRIVMGSDQVEDLIPPDADLTVPPTPTEFQRSLTFDLSLAQPAPDDATPP